MANPRWLFLVTAIAESVTGLALVVLPDRVLALLLGSEHAAPETLLVGRLAGAALLAIGIACWWARDDRGGSAQLGLAVGLLIYNLAATALLVWAAVGLQLVGVLLWPAVGLHTAATIWCGLVWIGQRVRLNAVIPNGDDTADFHRKEEPMRLRMWWLLAAPAVLLALVAQQAPAQEKNLQAEAALLKKAESFVAAFHNGDAKALAGHWSTDGDYTNQTGKTLKGRDAIEKAFTGLFAENKGLKLRIDSLSLRFITPDVAIEDGLTSVLPPDGGPPSRARYTIVHVRRSGEWYLSSVRDAPYAPPGNHEHLAELEWLVGEWVDANAKGETARIAYQWGENQNFLIGEFTTTFKQFAIGGGTHRIGWDPANKQIRSWTFEVDGGFGGGLWTRAGEQWTIQSSATLKDGKKMTASGILKRVNPDTMTLEFRDRTIDGQPTEAAKMLTFKRVNGTAAANGR